MLEERVCRNLMIRALSSHPPSAAAIVTHLKHHPTDLPTGQTLHAHALKSGHLPHNLHLRNALTNLYARSSLPSSALSLFSDSPAPDTASHNIILSMLLRSAALPPALRLFQDIPRPDCVSYTTLIMGLAHHGFPSHALQFFRRMIADNIPPNSVTLATVISATIGSELVLNMVHAVAVKCILTDSVLVSTSLIHVYAACGCLDDARVVFDGMPERNVVTWNALLNAYVKGGEVESAVEVFGRMPERDLVSWSTMMDGYIRVGELGQSLLMYREMLREVGLRPNEVVLVDLLSACGRLSAVREGRQLHAVVVRAGLDCNAFVQATLIHFYAVCRMIDLAWMQFRWGNQTRVTPWNAMIGGFVRNRLMDAARGLFDEMPERDVVSWSTLISGYVQIEQSGVALELFREMLSSGVQPNEITLASVLSAVANSGNLEEGKWIDNYIQNNSVPFTDNLAAGLIDMYAKCGSIKTALQVFNHAKEASCSVSPWNAIICGLAMHGDVDMSLKLFSDLGRRNIKPNLITFIGVLNACCHAGLVDTARHHFHSMKNVYNLEPTIKHYGCMVDLLGRSGCFEEAERLIESMPMKADVTIWGSMLAAAKTHGDVELGERAAASLASLEPSHGGGKVLMSNIYADAGLWENVFRERKAMRRQGLTKVPGCSGIVGDDLH